MRCPCCSSFETRTVTTIPCCVFRCRECNAVWFRPLVLAFDGILAAMAKTNRPGAKRATPTKGQKTVPRKAAKPRT